MQMTGFWHIEKVSEIAESAASAVSSVVQVGQPGVVHQENRVDERMVCDGEEENETTMGEGVVAVEGETTKDGEELPVVV